ncbi:hypothetical protein [Homoserinimonas hongtaonis]|uniref:hypothetical protein n=1 Tax=Homoserinimonas hongtaonis TaxID=2079791 RepID=UPI000D3B1138|nr:hypothetical protein [Salinibacterium hongtaonis]AWB90402.1 hypothetical protein C2138_13320 [Salinibacterium hongtaonis]
MTVQSGEESADPRRRILIRASVLFGILLVAFIAVVVALNTTVFSASGFVSSYLNAVARHDLQAALAMPGVRASGDSTDEVRADEVRADTEAQGTAPSPGPAEAGAGQPEAATPTSVPSTALLVREALASLENIKLVDDDARDDGTHALSYSYELDGTPQTSTFIVERTGIHLAFFSAWSFAQSPLTTLEITPLNTVEFESNGISAVAVNGPGQPTSFAVLVPSALSISHNSTYLVAEPQTALILRPGESEQFTLEVHASAEFIGSVQRELEAQLDGCAAQKVLLPTGCPFGKSISDRIDGLPQWAIVDYPVVSIVAGEQLGTWLIEPALGLARLSVDVRSLFDGTVTRLKEDVSFSVSYLATFTSDGGLILTPMEPS